MSEPTVDSVINREHSVRELDLDSLDRKELIRLHDWNLLTPAQSKQYRTDVAHDPGTPDLSDVEYVGHVETGRPETYVPSDAETGNKSLDQMNKDELKEQAELRDLPVSGNKDELLERIVAHDESES